MDINLVKHEGFSGYYNFDGIRYIYNIFLKNFPIWGGENGNVYTISFLFLSKPKKRYNILWDGNYGYLNDSVLKTLDDTDIIFTPYMENYKKYCEKINIKYLPTPSKNIIKTNIKKNNKIWYKKNNIVYFGNLYNGKEKMYNKLKNILNFDTITNNVYNGEYNIECRSELYHILRQYDRGIGVGICFKEMVNIGLSNVLVCGNKFGGVVKNEVDWYNNEH